MMKLKRVLAVAVILGFALSMTASAADVTWNVAGDGVWDTTTPNWTGGSTTYTDGDNVTFDNAAGGVITILGMSPASTTVNAPDGTTYTFVSEVPTGTGAPSILTGTLVKEGPGTLELGAIDLAFPGSSQYTNGFTSVTVNGGSLIYADNDAFGTEATLTMAGGTTIQAKGKSHAEGRFKFNNEDVANDFVLSGGAANGGLVNVPMSFGNGKDVWLKGNVSGPGGFNVTGSSRDLSLSGDNTFEGGVTLTGSSNGLVLGSYSALGTGVLTLGQNAPSHWRHGVYAGVNLDGEATDYIGNVNPNGIENDVVIMADKYGYFDGMGDNMTLLLSGVISGEGTLAKDRRNSTVILAGDNTYTGGTVVEKGTLTINGSLADATMTIDNVSRNGAEAPGIVNGTGTITFNIDGATTDLIQVMNGGTLDISGLNVNINEVGAGLTEDAYVLVDYGVVDEDPEVVIGAGIISGAAFAGLTAPAGYEIDYDYMGAGKQIALVLATLLGDFNDDGNLDLVDINALTAVGSLPVGLPVALSDPKYDLTGDDMINTADLDEWLAVAATNNGLGSPYLKGDANLDGDVDVFAIDGSGDAQILSSNLGTAAGAVWGDGDFNGDGDVDVFAIDGSGDAQLLSSNLGSSSDATAGTAEAIYNAVTGELSFDVGENIAVIGVQAEGLDHAAVDAESNLGAPAQNGGGILAYFNASGLKAGMADVGAVLPTGLTAEDIGFSFTPIGGDSTVVPVTVVVPEPSTIAMLLVLGAVALCWRRRNA